MARVKGILDGLKSGNGDGKISRTSFDELNPHAVSCCLRHALPDSRMGHNTSKTLWRLDQA